MCLKKINQELGLRLEILRLILNLNQVEMAKELNFNQSTYSKMTRGNVRLKWDQLDFLCKKYQIDSNAFGKQNRLEFLQDILESEVIKKQFDNFHF